ncbi:MAG: LytTR family DNA-binding domain-containing protein [Clostridiales bacterium]|nr:LytTR family DNA-binding domain-containing protein [Clostridiales bacterium]
MSYKIAIVEDEPAAAEELKDFLARYSKESGEKFDAVCFSDGIDITENYKPVYDIIFLDIKMRHMNGMAAAKFIRKLDRDAVIVFVTNVAALAIRGYEVEALYYLLKPVEYPIFSKILMKSVDIAKGKSDDFLLIHTEQGTVRLRQRDILYAEFVNRRVSVRTAGKEYVCSGTMGAFEGKLRGKRFFRCNSGCLVNLGAVGAVRDNVAIVGKDKLLISRQRKKEFMRALAEFYAR